MNYFGKFDGTVSDALGQHPGSHLYSETVHATQVPSGAIVVPDAQLLFGGEFKRTGVDLVLSGDGRELVLHDYFKGEKHAALASPDGAHLTGDLVNALAGQVQYAQAGGPASAGQVIGHVTKLAGTATAVRNGVSIILNNGDNVEKGDVVQSGSDSTVGITFIDGTVFGLSSNARMVLNEMVYDPNGSNNSSLLSLVAGTITFVAGETAKHGDMKIDTPVATMGIRGTAVLVEIDFSVPGATPDAKFQVLVEPDGTTGSYILFDKTTLTPLAVVDKAGLQINISDGLMSQTLAPLSPEIQKLISDVFSLKFSDSSNTKSIEHFTDSIIPNAFGPSKFAFANGNTPTIPVIVNLVVANSDGPDNGSSVNVHLPIPPTVVTSDALITERLLLTGSKTPDMVTGTIKYADINPGDLPTASVTFGSANFTNAKGQAVTLNPLELADIKAVEVDISVIQDPGNKNTGTANWTYSVPDGAFDFLAAGEKLTLTYNAIVNNNYAPNDLTTTVPITITITGTNDAPVITTSQQNISFIAGTGAQGGDLLPNTTTAGTLAFTDADLSDTHTVAVNMASALLNGEDLSKTVSSVVLGELAAAVTAKIGTDSTGTGAGTVNWTLADLEVSLADVIPTGESLVLTYVVTVTDSQGATSTQDIVVTISDKATAWSDINPIPPGGTANWNVGANWTTGLVPNSTNDTLIGADQFLPGTPVFPVTVDDAEGAKSLTMDDFGTSVTELDVTSTGKLTIAGALEVNTSASSALTAEVIIKNFGNISVGGVAELLKHSVLNNAGTLFLAEGGDFKDQSSITNSGTIELGGGTLNVLVDIANSGPTAEGTIKIDSGATLIVADGATITNGNLTIASGGSVDVEAGTSGPGATLDGVTVSGSITVSFDATLTLDTVTLDGVTLSGGTDSASAVTVSADSEIENATVSGDLTTKSGVTLTLNTVTLDGATLSGGTDHVSAMTVSADSTIENATVSGDTVTVESGVTLKLDDVTVNGTTFTDTLTGGTIKIDSGKTLTFNGATIDGGTLNIQGEMDSTGNSFITGATIINSNDIVIVSGTLTIDPTPITNTGTIEVKSALVLSDEVVTNSVTEGQTTTNGTIQVDQNATLTLENATINGGILNNFGTIDLTGDSSFVGLSSFINEGTLDAEGALTLTGMTIDNAGHTLQSSGSGIIDLVNTTINGGTLGGKIETVSPNKSSTLNGVTIAFGTLVTAVFGILELTGTVNNLGEIDATNGTLDLENAAINGGTLGGTGTIATASDNSYSDLNGVTIVNGATVTATTGTLDLKGTIFNNGEIDVAATGKLYLDDAVVIGGTLGGAGPISTGGLNHLSTLNNVTIVSGTKVTAASGTLELTGTIANNGEIDATNGVLDLSNAVITGGTLGGDGTIVTISAFNEFSGVTIANGTNVDVADGTTLDLVGTITNHGTISLDSSGHGTELEISGSVSLVGGGNVTMTDNSQNSIGSDGSAATLTNSDTISGAGTIGDAHLTLVNNGTIDATGSHPLIIDTGVDSVTPGGIVGNLLVTNDVSGVLEAPAGHTLLVEDNVLNNGLIESGSLGADSTGAYVDITGNVSGAGSIEIFDYTKAEIGGSVSSNQTVSFGAPGGPLVTEGTLTLDDSKDFHGTIAGLAAGDVIGLTDLAYASDEHAVWTQTTTADGGSGTLQIYDGSGTLESTLDLTGTYAQNQFSLAQDASQGTDVHINYVSFAGGTINVDGVYTPQISNGGSTIELTNSLNFEATSWFDNAVYSISKFTASFDYVATVGDDPADGMAFILQNSSAGVHALGGHGHSLGYGGPDTNQSADDVTAISPSAAIELNLYAPNGQGTAFATDGGVGNYGPTGSVAFASGDEIQAVISYNGSILNETLTDLVTGATYSANYAVDLASVLGGDTATVGFSAATGASVSTQVISDFAFASPAVSSTIVANAPNQALSGFAAADTFVFNFAGVGKSSVTDFHAATDTLQFNSAIFANAQAALNATHDDGHGNTVVTIDAHDSITLDGVLKAQLHATDFHVV